jgi:iron complex outermembrane receptor protein
MVAEPMGMLNAGVSKQVLKNKGTIRVTVRDFLDIQEFRGYSRYQNIDIKIRNQWDNRVANVTFTYRFGKAMQNTPQRKKGGSNEEQSRVNAGGNSN